MYRTFVHLTFSSDLTPEGYEVIRSVVFIASDLTAVMDFNEKSILDVFINNIK